MSEPLEPGHAHRIGTIYAWVSEDTEGHHALLYVPMEDSFEALLGSDKAKVASKQPIVAALVESVGCTAHFVQFSYVAVLETLKP